MQSPFSNFNEMHSPLFKVNNESFLILHFHKQSAHCFYKYYYTIHYELFPKEKYGFDLLAL